MYRKQVRRRRAVLIGLVLVALVLITATFSGGSNPVQSVFGTVFGPVETGLSRVLKPGRDLINWFDETFDARGENDRLKDELEKARKQAVAGQVALQENAQLRGMVDMKRNGLIPEGYDPVTARVVARSPTLWYSSVTVDQGSGDGVRVNDPVISADGLVGRVSSVRGGTAVVTLITDGSSAVTAKVVPRGVQGVVKPEVGRPGRLTLDFLDSTRKVARGQTVVSSGWRAGGISSFYPPNLPIGEIIKAPIAEQEATQQVKIRPYADMRELDLVQVLTGGDRGGSGK